MASKTLLDSPIWKLFEAEAHKRCQDPEDLVTAWIHELLEVWEDEALYFIKCGFANNPT